MSWNHTAEHCLGIKLHLLNKIVDASGGTGKLAITELATKNAQDIFNIFISLLW